MHKPWTHEQCKHRNREHRNHEPKVSMSKIRQRFWHAMRRGGSRNVEGWESECWEEMCNGLVQGWESECWGVLGIPLFENNKVCRIHQMFVSFFDRYEIRIQDLEILFNQSSLFPVASLHKIGYKWNIKNSKSTVPIGSESSSIFRFSDSQIWNIHMFAGCSQIRSCIFWNILMRNTGSTGPDFVIVLKFQKSFEKYCNRSGITN